MTVDHLELYLHERPVGVVSPVRDNAARITLHIEDDFDDGGIALTEAFTPVPGRSPAVDKVSNFLGGYVPEGNHRERMAAKRRIDKDNLFALLDEFGGSIAGALTLRRPLGAAGAPPSYEELSEGALAAKLAQALTDSDQGIPDDSRSTLPGYQPKVLVARIDDAWVYPHGRAHSTWILKPQVPHRGPRLFDEHYGHLLSRHIGMSSYASEIHQAGATTYLAIERFDRSHDAAAVTIYHQEDLAQAMALDWRDTDVKFQEPSWPEDPRRASAARIATLLADSSAGSRGVEQWIAQLTFHIAIGNNDAHAKNVALMHLASGSELSPVYDAVPNLFQDGLINWDLALAVDGVFDHRRISVERLLAETRSWGLISDDRALRTVEGTLARMRDAVGAVIPPAGISPGVPDQISWSVDRLLAGDPIGERPR